MISSDFARHSQRLRGPEKLKVEKIYLHRVGKEQQGFIEAFGREVLLALKGIPF